MSCPTPPICIVLFSLSMIGVKNFRKEENKVRGSMINFQHQSGFVRDAGRPLERSRGCAFFCKIYDEDAWFFCFGLLAFIGIICLA